MNFRFAHYDPPKKKTVRTQPTNSKSKVTHRPAKTAQARRRSVPASKEVEVKKDEEAPRSQSAPTIGSSTPPTSISTPATSNSSSKPISTPATIETSTSDLPDDQAALAQTVIYTYLGQGRLDPFDIYPVAHVPFYVKHLLDHALHNKWAHVSPADPFATKRGWLQCALSSPVAFYALSFAASQHLNYLNYGKDPDSHAALLRLSYKTEAVKLINRHLTKLNGAPIPDSLLIAILSLGAHGHKPVPHTNAHEDRLRGPKSPLASAQMLDFYGHIDQETAHMSALRTLLNHNNGVSGIKLPGLAGALALGDLLHSTITHQRPSLHTTTPVRSIRCVARFLPPVERTKKGEEEEEEEAVNAFPVTFKTLGRSGNARKLIGTLTVAQGVTVALDRYSSYASDRELEIEDGKEKVTLEALTLARNDVHHALIDLPAANPLWGREFAVYDVLRIAGLIYSDLVLFPLPAETGVRGRYAKMMREQMEKVVQGMGGGGREEVGWVLWCCMLGAVAAAEIKWKGRVKEEGGAVEPKSKRLEMEGWELRMWYIGKVRGCAEMLGVGLAKGFDGWDDVREKVCSRYLWWDDVCDRVGEGVWEEVVLMHNEIVDRSVNDIYGVTPSFDMLFT